MKKKTMIELDTNDIKDLIIESMKNKGYKVTKDNIKFKTEQGYGLFSSGGYYFSGASVTIMEDI